MSALESSSASREAKHHEAKELASLLPVLVLEEISPSFNTDYARTLTAWARDVLPNASRLPLPTGFRFAVPQEEDVQRLTAGEKRELTAYLQSLRRGAPNPDQFWMFEHVFEALHVKATQTTQELFIGNVSASQHTTAEDHNEAFKAKSSLLYGELLPSAVSKMMGEERLAGRNAKKFCDLGMGLGKCAVQAFLAFPNLMTMIGIELAPSRAKIGFAAVRGLSAVFEKNKVPSKLTEGAHYCKLRTEKRVLELRCQNLFESQEAFDADVVVLETAFPSESHSKLCTYMNSFKTGARVLTYENLEHVYGALSAPFGFKRLPINNEWDRYFTSWSPRNGHHFYLWVKV